MNEKRLVCNGKTIEDLRPAAVEVRKARVPACLASDPEGGRHAPESQNHHSLYDPCILYNFFFKARLGCHEAVNLL